MYATRTSFQLPRRRLANVLALVAYLVLVATVKGQDVGFRNLVTNRDGGQLYFLSYYFRHKPSGANCGWYHYAPGGGIRAFTLWDSESPNVRSTVGHMDVSADGRLFAQSWSYAMTACIPNAEPQKSGAAVMESVPQVRCYPIYYSQNRIVGPGIDRRAAGEVQLSRNGRWALQYSYAPLALLETSTWKFTPVGPRSATETSRRALTSRGEVLVAGYTPEIELWSPEGSRRFTPAEPPASRSAVISDAGNWIAYLTKDARLHSIEVASGADRLLHSDPARSCHFSDDGSLVLFVAEWWPGGPPQVFAVQPDGNRKRQLTFLREGCAEAALSGDGRVAYTVTTTNRLLRIDVGAGAIEELIGRTPHLYAGSLNFKTPGSFVRLLGSGLSDGVAAASGRLPGSLAGASVRIGGLDLRILSASPTEIRGQIPWETIPGSQWMEVPSQSDFETPPDRSEIRVSNPEFWVRYLIDSERGSDPPEVIVHEGFDSLVTYSSPARPGEIVHLYAVGFGPVWPPVATGEPAPAKPLALVSGLLGCKLEGVSVPILYAGLAPGLYGIYQISVRLPEQPGGLPGQGSFSLYCGLGTPDTIAHARIPIRAQE